MLLVALTTLLAVTHAGKITPKSSFPIKPRYNNQSITSDYSFSLQIETFMPEDSVLKIHFPRSDYQAGLGIGTCEATWGNGDPIECKVQEYTVTLEVGELSNQPLYNTYEFIVKDVLNPARVGGTSQFRLETFIGDFNILDWNDMFGQVGIIGTHSDLNSASFECVSNCKTGQIGIYALSFQVAATQPSNSRVGIQFPSQLGLLEYVPCTSMQLSGIFCDVDEDNYVTVVQISQSIVSGQTYTITFTDVQNPGYVLTLDTVMAEILEGDVNNIVYRAEGITPPTIEANAIFDIKVCPNSADSTCNNDLLYLGVSNASYKLTYDYTFVGTTTNNIPQGGALVIQIPSQLTPKAETCIVNSGFLNLGTSEDDQVSCTVSGQTLTITNFDYFTNGEFQLTVSCDNPTSANLSTASFLIRTYQNTALTQLIDEGTGEQIYFDNKEAPALLDASSITFNSLPGIRVSFQPSSVLTAGSGSVKIRLASGFQIDGTLAATYTAYNTLGSTALTPSYDSNTRTLTIPISANNASTGGTSFIDVGTNSGNGIIEPSDAGDYILEYILDYNDGTINYRPITWTVSAPSFTSFTATRLSIDVSKQTAYRFNFTPSMDILAGTPGIDITQKYGKLKITFETQNTSNDLLWPINLGTGLTSRDQIPCRGLDGLIPASGSEIECILVPAASAGVGNLVTIEVINFKKIAKGTAATLDIPKLTNSQTGGVGGQIVFTANEIEQGLVKPLQSQTHSFSNFYDDGNLSLPIYNGRSPSSLGGDNTNLISLSSTLTGASSTITLILWPETTMTTAQSSFIIKLPAGFSINKNSLECKINYIMQTDCTAFPNANWVVLRAPTQTTSTFAVHTEYTLTISGLTNPKDTETISGLQVVYILNQRESEYSVYVDFTDILPAPIAVVVSPDSELANSVDVSYTWIFTLSNDLEEDAYILLTYPENDYVLTTEPTPQCEISGSLLPKSSNNPIQCAFDSNTVTITNFAAHTAGGAIVVKNIHVLNPPELIDTDYFQIETYNASNQLRDANYKIPGLSITRRANVSKIAHNAFFSNPSNGGYETDLTIEFTPSDTIPVDSQLRISLPDGEFNNLSGNLDCSILGGLSMFKSCVGEGSIVSIVTNSAYSKVGTPITVIIYDIMNFSAGLTSGLISIEILYSDTIFQESSDKEENRRYTTTLGPSSLSVADFSYFPLTAAELATYTFGINLSNELTPECSLNIEFSSTVPRELSYYIDCRSEQLGVVQCSANWRTLTIKGSRTYTPSKNNKLVVQIDYITNPNNGDTFDGFKVFTQCGLDLINYGRLESNQSLSGYPSSISLTNIELSNTIARETANYSIDFSLSTGVATNEDDRIFVYFPLGYDIEYASSMIKCSFGEQTLDDPCEYSSNRVSIAGFSNSLDTSLTTSYKLNVNNVENPEDTGYARFLQIAIYDFTSNTIIAKSFPNLNKAIRSSFQEQGADIIINYGRSWSVLRGTRSSYMYAVIDQGAPAAVDLMTKLPDGVEIHPYPIHFDVGDFVASFTITANQNTASGEYTLAWTVSGDWQTSPFSPVRRTDFMVQEEGNEWVLVDFDDLIPFGGCTLPTKVTLTKSPAAYLEVNIIQLGELPTQIRIEPNRLKFYPGQFEKTFKLCGDFSTVGYDGTIFIYTSGENQDAYLFEQQVFDFEIGKRDMDAADVRTIIKYNVERTAATFRVDVNERVEIFYMLALAGTREPTPREFNNFMLEDSMYLLGNPIFNSTYTYTMYRDKYRYDWTVEGLMAQTEYVIYIYAQDPAQNGAEIQSLVFKTSDRHPTATFRLRYLDTPLSVKFLEKSIEEIAKLMRVSADRIAIREEFYTQSQKDLTNDDPNDVPTSTTTSVRGCEGFTKVEYIVFPEPTNAEAFTPMALIARLEERRLELKQVLDLLDVEYKIEGYELIPDVPSFIGQPVLGSVTDLNAEIEGILLDSPGYIYICVEVERDTSIPVPSATQVFNGVNSMNMPCLDTLEIPAFSGLKSAQFDKLPAGRNLAAFLAASNTMERYRDVNSEVKAVYFATVSLSDDDRADWLHLVFLLLLVIQ